MRLRESDGSGRTGTNRGRVDRRRRRAAASASYHRERGPSRLSGCDRRPDGEVPLPSLQWVAATEPSDERRVPEWRERAAQARDQEAELLIDPGFFWTLDQEIATLGPVKP